MRLSRRAYLGVDPVVLVEVLLFFFFFFAFLLFLPVPDVPASAPPLALAFAPVPGSVLPPVVLVPAWANAPAVASAALTRTARLVFHILICVPPPYRGEMAAGPR